MRVAGYVWVLAHVLLNCRADLLLPGFYLYLAYELYLAFIEMFSPNQQVPSNRCLHFAVTKERHGRECWRARLHVQKDRHGLLRLPHQTETGV
jgi:hypothetical protein